MGDNQLFCEIEQHDTKHDHMDMDMDAPHITLCDSYKIGRYSKDSFMK